jgi:hypothetical protein
MSSSGDGDRFTMGAQVDATDGRCGHLTRVIVDPAADALTHLVVEPGHHEEGARLVPIDLVVSAEDDVVRLKCTREQFGRLDSAEDVQVLQAGATPGGYGPDASLRPYFSVGMSFGHRRQSAFADRIPAGEVEIRRGDAVHAKDGLIGAVEGIVIDPADHHVTHVILQEGHVWGRKKVAIPIGAANRVGDEIRVDLTKEEIEALPPVSLRSQG